MAYKRPKHIFLSLNFIEFCFLFATAIQMQKCKIKRHPQFRRRTLLATVHKLTKYDFTPSCIQTLMIKNTLYKGAVKYCCEMYLEWGFSHNKNKIEKLEWTITGCFELEKFLNLLFTYCDIR